MAAPDVTSTVATAWVYPLPPPPAATPNVTVTQGGVPSGEWTPFPPGVDPNLAALERIAAALERLSGVSND